MNLFTLLNIQIKIVNLIPHLEVYKHDELQTKNA